uniref:XPG N-terminal domain-containing protein n=1 Tax=Globisporangium ultimum (strain ATCC 200006 / CBS 805.95 / DAOM BR144) TaxID=431595 RepID=K3WLQ4_GLOUD
MGVQNLWVLLAPVGRQIEIESLTNKVLAVDASIWLTQFVKAMRDDEGNMIKNAHVIGTFHRVAKLLFYRIKPVFVFDGQTPEIKKRTTARRRKRQEHQAANLKQTAQRILINRLKLQREELKRNGGKPTPAVDPNFVLPDMVSTTTSHSGDNTVQGDITDGGDAEKPNEQSSDGADGVIEVDGSSSDEKESADEGSRDVQQARRSNPKAATVDQNDRENGSSDDERQDLTVDDIDLDTSQLSKLDLQAVFALPAHLQKDMINRILRDRRQEVRNKFIPLAGQPEAYSHNQIASFLATSALHKRIEAAKKKNREHIEGAEVSDAVNLGPGKRIASRSDRFFVYKKAEDHDEDENDDDNVKERKEEDDDDMNDGKIIDEIESVSREANNSIFAVDDAENGFPGLIRTIGSED